MATKQELATANMFEFKKHVELSLQQKQSKLRACVTEKSCEGERSALVEVFKPSEAYEIVGDMPETIYNDTGQERRWVSFRQYGWAERLDPFASLDSGINPLLSYAQLATMAMHRKQDDAILGGMLGCNKKGKNAETEEKFPEENIIKSTGAGDNFFNTFVGQLIKAKAIFKKRHIDLESEQLYVGVPSDVWASLFALERVVNKDYVNSAALQAGKIESFAGFWFVDIEKVPGDDSFPTGTHFPGLTDPVYEVEYNSRNVRTQTLKSSAEFSGGTKYVLPVWCKSAVVFSQRKNLTIEHSKDPSRWHAPQLTLTASFGATRVEPQKVLGIEISKASLADVPKVSKVSKAA